MSVRSMTMHAESIRLASEGLTWLEHLFVCIANAPDAGLHAKRLAEIGRYLASDAADSADCAYAEMRSDIEKYASGQPILNLGSGLSKIVCT